MHKNQGPFYYLTHVQFGGMISNHNWGKGEKLILLSGGVQFFGGSENTNFGRTDYNMFLGSSVSRTG